MTKAGVVKELFRNARKNFPRRHVILKSINDLFQSDIIDMQNYAPYNAGYTYILIVINAFTKYFQILNTHVIIGNGLTIKMFPDSLSPNIILIRNMLIS